MKNKSGTAIICPGVKLGKNAVIGEFVIIGEPPIGKQPGEIKTVIGKNALIRSHTVIYAGNTIGDNFQTGHGVNIRENNTIGDNVSIGTHSVVEHHVSIGNQVRIHSNVFICEYSVLEDECWVGPSVTLLNAKHPKGRRTKEYLKGPVLKKWSKVGGNVTLLPGVIIGEMALVGGGSVVTKDVPGKKVVAGNPALVIKDLYDLTGPFGQVYEKEDDTAS